MIIDHYGTLSRFLLEKAAAINFNLQGPAEIEYGFGWEPTVSFWFEHRRVHFYFDFDGKMTVEVSEVQPGLKIKRGEIETDSLVRRAVISTTEEAWDIVDRFLRQHCDFENLPKYDWIIDSLDHDKFIPHPPSAPNAGNITSLVTVMQQVGEPWHPQLQKKQSWLQRLRNWSRRPRKNA